MTDTTVVTERPKPAAAKARRRSGRRASTLPAKPKNELAGLTVATCCTACTAERCVISTAAVCKHPYKTADNGCGPVTLANREKARKMVKRQKIDAVG